MALRHFITVAGVAAFSCAPMAPVAAQQKAGVYLDTAGKAQSAQGFFCVPAADGTGCPNGSGSGGDASAANQSTQIAVDQTIRDRLGDFTTPAAGTVNARLQSLLSALGNPFQAGGSIANTVFGSTQSGAWTVGISGTVPISAAILPLPTGAATDTTVGSLFKAGQSIGNTGFAINGTLPGFTSPPTVNIGTAPATQPATTAITGTLSGVGQTVEVPLSGLASGLWTISSTNFVGTVVSEGCIEATCANPGGRLLFKSGVGSIGTTQIILTGGTIAREYRVVGGGNRIRLRVTAYTSGTLTATGYGQFAPNVLFINGPVHTGEEEAVRAGRAYLVSSQLQSVPAGSNLIATISNPAGSAVNAFVTMRMFECNQATATTPIEWTTYAGPTTVPTTSVTPVNRMIGGAASTTQFRYQVTTSATMGGTVADNGTLVTGGGPTPNMIMSTIVPGQTGGVLIGGAGGGLAAAQRCKVSYALYEESTN